MSEENLYNKLRQKCHDKALHSFGYAYIFDKRAQKYAKYINWLKVMGLLVPSIVGATVIGFGIKNEFLENILPLAIFVSIIQFALSVLAVIYKWDDELSYSFEASQEYNSLHIQFDKLANFPPPENEYDNFNLKYDSLIASYTFRNQQDGKHNVKEWERRKGMRYALREKKRSCEGCKKTPISIENTNCPVCGNYNFQNKLSELL